MKARVLIREDVIFQEAGREGRLIASTRHGIEVETEEGPYLRTMKIGQEWVRIDYGWVESVRLLCLRNESVKFQAIPTDDERREAEGRVVELGCEDDTRIQAFALLRPGDTARFPPVGPIYARCRTGAVKLDCAVIPHG